MENAKSLFPNKVWKKLEKNETAKKIKFRLEVPNFIEREDGVVLPQVLSLKIYTTSQLKAYEEKIRKYYDHINQKYPNDYKVVRILDNTLAELSDPEHTTKIGKFLSGAPVKSSTIFEENFSLDPANTICGFISTYNRDVLGFEGKKVALPRVKRPRETAINIFKKNPVGFFVPEIDEKGLVVTAGKNNKNFNIKLVAVNTKDITNEQFFDYITAPFGARAKESGVPFDLIKELSMDAYKSIGTSQMGSKVELLINFCTAYYPLSFANIKQEKAPVKPVTAMVVSEKEESAGLKAEDFYDSPEEKYFADKLVEVYNEARSGGELIVLNADVPAKGKNRALIAGLRKVVDSFKAYGIDVGEISDDELLEKAGFIFYMKGYVDGKMKQTEGKVGKIEGATQHLLNKPEEEETSNGMPKLEDFLDEIMKKSKEQGTKKKSKKSEPEIIKELDGSWTYKMSSSPVKTSEFKNYYFTSMLDTEEDEKNPKCRDYAVKTSNFNTYTIERD